MLNLKPAVIVFAVINLHAPTIFANPEENHVTRLVKKTLIITATSCMSHVNATEEDLEYLRKDPPFPEKSACIVKCLMEKIGIVKSDKFTKSGFLAAVSPLVLRNKKKMEHMKMVAQSCDKEIVYQPDMACQVANEVAKCIFKHAPELQFKA